MVFDDFQNEFAAGNRLRVFLGLSLRVGIKAVFLALAMRDNIMDWVVAGHGWNDNTMDDFAIADLVMD